MHTASLKPGDFFCHPDGSSRINAIWLALFEQQAISVKSGSVVNIGPGEVMVFDQVMFLDDDTMLRCREMKGGAVFMAGNDMLIKSDCGLYYSLGGGQLYSDGNTYRGWDWDALCPVFNLCLGAHGKTPWSAYGFTKPVTDYGLSR